MLDADKFAAFIRFAPFLYHVTRATNVERIKCEGLRPGSEIGAITRDDFFSTRPGHIYLIGLADVPIVEVGSGPRVFAVELAALDPALVAPDEDMVRERFRELVSVPPPDREMKANGVEGPGQRGALAKWAEETPGFDRSEVTERSLFEHRRLAYRGVIPPDALGLVPMPSGVLAAFEAELSPDVGAILPASPPWGGWRTEVARARAVVGEAVRGVLRAVDSDVDVQASGPEQARSTSARLRPVIRTLQQLEGRFAEAEVVISAQSAIEVVERLEGLAPVSDERTAIEIARAAAGAVNALSSAPIASRDQAGHVAVEAASAALGVTST